MILSGFPVQPRPVWRNLSGIALAMCAGVLRCRWIIWSAPALFSIVMLIWLTLLPILFGVLGSGDRHRRYRFRRRQQYLRQGGVDQHRPRPVEAVLALFAAWPRLRWSSGLQALSRKVSWRRLERSSINVHQGHPQAADVIMRSSYPLPSNPTAGPIGVEEIFLFVGALRGACASLYRSPHGAVRDRRRSWLRPSEPSRCPGLSCRI